MVSALALLAGTGQQPPAGAAELSHWPAVLAAALAGVAIAMNVGKVPLALPLLRAELSSERPASSPCSAPSAW